VGISERKRPLERPRHRWEDNIKMDLLEQWYSTFFVRIPPHIISLQLCTPKVVGA
jgi:hypothetical protein